MTSEGDASIRNSAGVFDSSLSAVGFLLPEVHVAHSSRRVLTRTSWADRSSPPPMAMTFKDADFGPNLTMREKGGPTDPSRGLQRRAIR